MNTRFDLVWYDVEDRRVDLPAGCMIVDVMYEDRLGLGAGREPVAVLVAVPR